MQLNNKFICTISTNIYSLYINVVKHNLKISPFVMFDSSLLIKMCHRNLALLTSMVNQSFPSNTKRTGSSTE